jgi:ferredoxin
MQPDGFSTAIRYIIDPSGVQQLVQLLIDDGFAVVGPRVEDAVIVLGLLSTADDLAIGWVDEQAPARYRAAPAASARLLAGAAPAQSWKRYLYPAHERVWRGRRDGESFVADLPAAPEPAYALLGIRPCDLQAIRVQDRVLADGRMADPRYAARRQRSFIIAADCTRAGGACFCASMGSGPGADGGYDLAITDIGDGTTEGMGDGAGEGGRLRLLIRAGSDRGNAVLARLQLPAAGGDDGARGEAAIARAAAAMPRQMPADVREVLQASLEHRIWDEIGERCLGCGNCTLVCPTCFCCNIEDVTDLSGGIAERWRRWDSCFTIEFSYIHGGSIRRSVGARYRQWITHKLATWWEQFGMAGCVGCGRCITWCPVGIDITVEAGAVREASRGRPQ